MILWHESEEKFLKLMDKFRRIDDIIVLCENCNNKRIIKYVTWKNQMRINGNDMCSSCVAKYNRIKHVDSYKNSDHKRSKKISETMKKRYNHQREEWRIIRNSEIRQRHAEGWSLSRLQFHYGLSRQGVVDINKGFYA